MLKALYTIGYTKKSLREFVERLSQAGVDCVVDIRLNNTSQLAGFSKKDDLKFLLEQGFGIRYVHMVEFAPSEELLSDYKAGNGWDDYVQRYDELVREREMAESFLLAANDGGWERPCLLCAEDKSDMCHRRLLAEEVSEAAGGLEVVHL